MCGLAGCWEGRPRNGDALEATARDMAAALLHRGPDDEGTWADPRHGFSMGHRRLAILDLSPQGRQPMVSKCGRFVMAYNGEVYNFAELRERLEAAGDRFFGGSDSEVVLAAIARWGLEAALAEFIGMFAIALWDRRRATLTLVRDRFGIKPLFWGQAGRTLVFGSELKALLRHPQFDAEVDRDSLALLMRHNYVPAPHSIYCGVFKLAPGQLAVFAGPEQCDVKTWWRARDAVLAARGRPLRLGPDEVADRLDALLRKAVKARMVADVPLGAFLSGGIDSSTVVALMQAQSRRPVKTFSIGFFESGFDEAQYARRVARHLGTDHTELYVRPEEARAVIPELPRHWDEPFSDSSQIPTLIVSRLARESLTVSLSGDGGDELFNGYARYRLGCRLARMASFCPKGLHHILARLPGRFRKLAEVLRMRDSQRVYQALVSHWKDPASIVLGAHEPTTQFSDPDLARDLPDLEDRMMYLDTVTYLPGDILTKVDRASMAVGLEARVPLLDHRVFEFAWRLPPALRANKAPLRNVLRRYVPAHLFERRKQGFGVPLGAWLRGPLRGWAEELLDERSMRAQGFFDPAPIRRAWDEHLSGACDRHYQLWDVLSFSAWHAAARREAVHA